MIRDQTDLTSAFIHVKGRESDIEHCSTYFEAEITAVNPQVIVTMGNDPVEQQLNEMYGLDGGPIKAGTNHAGRRFEGEPPVVISPTLGERLLGRRDNRANVRRAIVESLR